MSNKKKKKEIRTEILKHRHQISKDEVIHKSHKITHKLESLPLFINSRNILVYIPIQNEVNIIYFIQKYLHNKNFFAPKITEENEISIHQINSLDSLEVGKYGIPEPPKDNPIKSQELDLIIVPGVAFSPTGIRIGFGGGYYDKFLKTTQAPKIALAYDFQIHQELPHEIHDEKIDLIITESQIIDTKAKK